MRIPLTVLDRLILLNLTQDVEGNIVLLREARHFREAIGFTDAELTELDFQEPKPGQMRWKAGTEPVAVEVGDAMRKHVADTMKRLDEQGKLKYDHVDLYEKFVGPGE